MRQWFWKVALAVIALMALYDQVTKQRAWQEEDRRAAIRMEKALAESRARVEILERHLAELAKEEAAEQAGDQPLPGAVLRRGESGGGSALQQVRDKDEQAVALTRLQESLDTLALRMERSDQALRRDLKEIRAGVRRERETSNKTLILFYIFIALIPFIVSLWPSGGKGG